MSACLYLCYATIISHDTFSWILACWLISHTYLGPKLIHIYWWRMAVWGSNAIYCSSQSLTWELYYSYPFPHLMTSVQLSLLGGKKGMSSMLIHKPRLIYNIWMTADMIWNMFFVLCFYVTWIPVSFSAFISMLSLATLVLLNGWTVSLSPRHTDFMWCSMILTGWCCTVCV